MNKPVFSIEEIRSKIKDCKVGDKIKLDCGIEGTIESLTKALLKIKTNSSIEIFHL